LHINDWYASGSRRHFPSTPNRAHTLQLAVPEADPLARLAPLISQLSLAYLRNRGTPLEVLRPAGKRGARHVGVLMSLLTVGPGTVAGLAERLGMTPAHASLVIGELADAGLVEREIDAADRRRVVVSLSAEAEPAVAEMRRRNIEPIKDFLDDLDDDQAEVFIGHLARLVALMADAPSSPA
jgi:DNA-binding MarR family transcriptional regulator